VAVPVKGLPGPFGLAASASMYLAGHLESFARRVAPVHDHGLPRLSMLHFWHGVVLRHLCLSLTPSPCCINQEVLLGRKLLSHKHHEQHVLLYLLCCVTSLGWQQHGHSIQSTPTAVSGTS